MSSPVTIALLAKTAVVETTNPKVVKDLPSTMENVRASTGATDVSTEVVAAPSIQAPIPSGNSLSELAFVVDYISMMATIFGVIMAIIAGLFVVATFLGLREIGQIRKLENQFRKMMTETNAILNLQKESIADLSKSKEQITLTISQLRDEINEKSRELIQAAHYFSAGETSYKEGDFERAVEMFTFALDNDHENPDVLYRLGRSYVNNNDLALAKQCFERSMAANPDWFKPYMGMATIHRFSDSNKALEYAREGIARQCEDHEAFDYAGLICRDLKMFDDAIQYHRDALELRNDPNTNFFLALLHFSQDDIVDAKRYIFNAISLINDPQQSVSIRSVWCELTRWLEALISDEQSRAVEQWSVIKPYLDNERVKSGVLAHAKFIAKARDIDIKDWTGDNHE